ncbi:MAG: proline dehydrogenase family protein [Cytophagaceae bacterium]|nr:proline dehydrogenase family protein [Cytophagaceae bacterium]
MLKKPPVSFEDTSVAFSSRSDEELRRMHFLFSGMSKEFLTKIGTFFVKTALKLKLPVKSVIKNRLFKQFCGGETLSECKATVEGLARYRIHTILDYAVEGESNDKSYDDTLKKILDSIELDAQSQEISFSVFKVTGLGSFSLLEKIQKGDELNDEERMAFARLRERMDIICKTAFEKDIRLMIDAEESWIQGAIDVLVYEMMKKYNKSKAIIYNTFQMYRSDMSFNLQKALEISLFENFILGAKLVRGAYMEKERRRAKELNYTSPIFSTKNETDEAFNKALEFCVQHKDRISLCCGSHNEKSTYHLIALMENQNIERHDDNIWFAQLYGMSDHISYNLAAAGYNVAKYVPYGPVEAVMPYLFRRAEENKAVTGGGRELEMVKREMDRRFNR